MPARPAKRRPERRREGGQPAATQQTTSRAQRSVDKKNQEKRTGIIMPFVFGIVAAIFVCLILMFLCQQGLAWTDRCNCSWERVILYSVFAFLACVIQLFPYLSYREKKRQYGLARTANAKKPIKQSMSFLMAGATIILIVAALVVFFILVPLFQDQNGNFLWFFTRGGGILTVVVTLLMSAGAGLFGKLFLAEYVN